MMYYRINVYGAEATGMIKFNSFNLWAHNEVEASKKAIAELSKTFSMTTIENEIAIDIIEICEDESYAAGIGQAFSP